MSNNVKALAIPIRNARLAVSLPCRLSERSAEAEGTVININLNGLGIELTHHEIELNLTAISEVRVDGLGSFDVECRWQRGNRMGVRFRDEKKAFDQVQVYLDSNDLHLT